jgi:hypothetical protein
LAIDGCEWSNSCPTCFTLLERALDTHWIGDLAGPRVDLSGAIKISCPCRGSVCLSKACIITEDAKVCRYEVSMLFDN